MNILLRLLAAIIFAAALMSCTSDKQAAPVSDKSSPGVKAMPQQASLSAAPAPLIEIYPSNPNRSSTLFLSSKEIDLSRSAVEWLVNGALASAKELHFSASGASRGDSVQAKVTYQGRTVYSTTVQIGNTPPEIRSIKFLPEVLKPGDRLSAEAAGYDADGDPVTFLYEWTRNGEPAGRGPSIDQPVSRGDSVTVRITPFDGMDQGATASQQMEIRNQPPVITEHREVSFNGTVYAYQVRASDPDGDPLTYSLETSASGMAIDQGSGLVTWNVPPDFKGAQDAVIVVNDGNGGIARYPVQFIIKNEINQPAR